MEGILQDDLLNLSGQPEGQLEHLRTTPGAGFIRSCRYKLKPEQQLDHKRLIQIFKKHNIRYFFYNGGGDSMNTCDIVAVEAVEAGLSDFIATGVPKTVDNDLCDKAFEKLFYCPGYGSLARSVAMDIHFLNQENKGIRAWFPVSVYGVMGREAGFPAAAAQFAQEVNEEEIPLQIYVSGGGLTIDAIPDLVNDQLKKTKRVILVVGEAFVKGLKVPKDQFGNPMYTTLEQIAAQKVVRLLNKTLFKTGKAHARGYAHADVPNTFQRHNALCISPVDWEDAYQVGRKAVKIALEGENGYMSTIKNITDDELRYGKELIADMKGNKTAVPQSWYEKNRVSFNQQLIGYLSAIIGHKSVDLPLGNFGFPKFATADTRAEMWASPRSEKRFVPEKYKD